MEVFSLLDSIPPPFNMVVVIVLIIFVTGLLTSWAKQIRKFACHRQELEFKREMLDRGLSVEEIDHVLQTKDDRSGMRG